MMSIVKVLLMVLSAVAVSLTVAGAGEEAQGGSQDERNRRDELIRRAAELQERAKEFLKAGVEEWEQNASESVKKAAAKVLEIKKDFGKTLNSLAEAYEKRNKKVLAELEERRFALERQLDLAEKEKFVACRLEELRNALAQTPDATELKRLYETAKQKTEAFLDLSRKINELELQRGKLERECRKLGREFEIARQKLVLKKMEKELEEGNLDE